MTALTLKQKKFLKGLAHDKKPVVTVGQKGLTATVQEEVDRALSHHELIKVKLPASDRKERTAMLETLCGQTNASFVTLIGRAGVIYRASEDKKISLPA